MREIWIKGKKYGETNRDNKNAETAAKLEIARSIAGQLFDGGDDIGFGGYCDTEADVADKEATVRNFKLTEGAIVILRFVHGNTQNEITLNVNGTGAKPVAYQYYIGKMQSRITANTVHLFCYNGGYWFLVGSDTADRWAAPRNINGMLIDGSADRANYGVCNTDADKAAKGVNCPGFALIKNAEITVNFPKGNTAIDPTLNVNGTGEVPIWYQCMPIRDLNKDAIYTFRYDGGAWNLVGNYTSVQQEPLSKYYYTDAYQDSIDMNFYYILEKYNKDFLPIKDTDWYSLEITDPNLNIFCIIPAVAGSSIKAGFVYPILQTTYGADPNAYAGYIGICACTDSEGDAGIALYFPTRNFGNAPWDYEVEDHFEVTVNVIHF